jgi:hypothetical protein
MGAASRNRLEDIFFHKNGKMKMRSKRRVGERGAC